mmetsp:Transcript_4317/g.7196  ORF Transcript_4317/g.7196 Transcript_4317/m.7196 type:complete len:453 (+) Transcript_4317:113-1471(+)
MTALVVRLIALTVVLQRLESTCGFTSPHASRLAVSSRGSILYAGADNLYNDFDEKDDDDDEEEDEYIDTAELGDWRTFRMNLAETGTASDKKTNSEAPRKSVSKENEQLLRSQSKTLAEEYESGIWAHEAPKPEVGGLVLRMPLEVELYRNTKHSVMGKKLRASIEEGDRIALWYRKAQIMCEQQMKKIAGMAEEGQIDASKLDEESNDFLQMYLDNQETWQEVCLVVDGNNASGKASALVLNRPMAFKLTENLAQLVLQGSMARTNTVVKANLPDLAHFMRAFGTECAVYVGGPDKQDAPATLIHGFKDLLGAKEVSPGTNIYMGGMDAAIQGVIDGEYKALDFRFFVGKHCFEDNLLELECILGKYQPIACARPLALKQCIALPKPLYHEVLELCGGELKMISQLELLKRDDISINLEVDEDDEDILDELDELSKLEDDDEEEDDDDFVI